MLVALAASVLALATSGATASDTLESAGDVLRYALPLTALGVTLVDRDTEGLKQWSLSGATTLGTVAVGKSVTGKLRPDGGADTSYPSGHAAWAFWGASFLGTRYGAAWGIPAYGLAALTAYSRIDAGSHFPDDVLAGASIALLSNWYWVRPISRNTAIEPLATPAGGVGIALRIADAPLQAVDAVQPLAQQPRFRFEYLVAPTFVTRNELQSHASDPAGTRFDLADLPKIDDPTVASIVRFDVALSPVHSLRFTVAPFEVRDRAQFAAPVSFDDVVFAPGVTTQVDYRFYDYRAGYRYAMNPQDRAVARLGITLQAARTSFNLDDGSGRHAEVSHWTVLPLAHVTGSFRIARHCYAEASVEGIDLGDSGFFELEAAVRCRASDAWELAAGITARRFRLEVPTLSNEASYRAPFLSLAHRW
jgi:membrane-associated phospholipid phosphatase